MSVRTSRCVVTLLMMVAIGTSLAAQAPGLPPVETIGGVSLPALPASVATAAVEAHANAKQAVSEARDVQAAGPSEGSNVAIEVEPGTTELVRIARNYLNRIITPFSNPKLLTVNQVEVRKEGASIYLTTSSERPVGVHILPNEPDDSRSISLTLIPARIPPRTIQLSWADKTATASIPVSAARAQRWEQSSPYEEKLLELAELVARGEVPDGYALADNQEGVACALPGVKFFAGQRLTGSRFSVFVLRATNLGDKTIELLGHAGCGAPGVALVAPWPDAYLDPGTSTEVYVGVVNESYEPQARGQMRRSLLER